MYEVYKQSLVQCYCLYNVACDTCKFQDLVPSSEMDSHVNKCWQ